MANQRTLLVDTNDFRALSGVNVTRLDIYAPGTRRAPNDVIPRKRGQVGAAGAVLDAYGFAVSIVVTGSSEADLYTKMAAVGTAVGGTATAGLVALIRRIPTGTSTHVDHSAAGQFVGFTTWEHINECTAKVDCQYINLDGGWTPDSGTTWLYP